MKPTFSTLVTIILLACLAGIASDIYSPSLSAISQDLAVPIDSVQWSMALYMLGLSLSQLIYGPLSDAFGRRPLFAVGLAIFLLGSFVCLSASTMQMFNLGRLVQGGGVAACAALWRSTFRDLYRGDTLAKYSSYLSIAIVIVVPASPTLGAFLQQTFGWRASFIWLMAYAIVSLLLLLFTFKETSQHHDKRRLNLSFIVETYKELLTSPVFMGYSLSVLLTYGAFFSWFTVGPVLLIDLAGHSPLTFGWISSGVLCFAMILGSLLNARLVTRFGLHTLLQVGWLLTFVAGVVLLGSHLLQGINTIGIVAGILLFYMGCPFIFANTFAGAFAQVGAIAGFAGALYGSLQIGGGFLIAALVSYLPDSSSLPLALVYMSCTTAAWAVYKWARW